MRHSCIRALLKANKYMIVYTFLSLGSVLYKSQVTKESTSNEDKLCAGTHTGRVYAVIGNAVKGVPQTMCKIICQLELC